MKKETILLFGDVHAPYHHEDALKFLSDVKKKYSPTKIICTGDLWDFHATSMHDSDPDLDGAGKELKESISFTKKLVKLFPKMDITIGNHDSMIDRRFKKHGLPSVFKKSFHDVFGLPKTWKFHFDLLHKMSNGENLYVVHGKKKNTKMLTTAQGCSTAHGHYHSQFGIQYFASSLRLSFGIDTGCLVDQESLAMAYGKDFTEKPILGCIVIENGVPRTIPMKFKEVN